MKKLFGLMAVVAAVTLMVSFAEAKKPVQDVSARRHPNIAAAQKLAAQAYERIVMAQKANEWDMDGHAQKAKELLDQVNIELKQAAEAANKNRPEKR